MPRKRKLPENAEQQVRRGTRNRTKKQRPGFIDPFSLRKKRKMTLEDAVLSPLSSLSDVSSVQVQDDNFGNQFLQSNSSEALPQLPVKKRPHMRIKHRSPNEVTPTQGVSPSIRKHLSRSPVGESMRPRLFLRLRLRRIVEKSVVEKRSLG